MGIIEAAKLAFEYKKYDENGEVEETIRAVDGVDLDVKKGDFVAILGHNGPESPRLPSRSMPF